MTVNYKEYPLMFKRKVCSVGIISCDKVYFSPLLTNELEFSKLGFRLATY